MAFVVDVNNMINKKNVIQMKLYLVTKELNHIWFGPNCLIGLALFMVKFM